MYETTKLKKICKVEDLLTAREHLRGQVEKVFATCKEIDPEQATEQEALGLVISSYFEWDGLKIFEAFYSALEDSNFHTENEKIAEIIDKLKGVGESDRGN